MRRLLPAAAILLGLGLGLGAGSHALADEAPEVELLTMGPGEDIFASFGHAALRVRAGRRDQVYNYGYTRFDDPALVLTFLRGRARFWVGRQPFRSAIEDYRIEDRGVERLRLALTPAQHAELARRLEENLLPENRNYSYHHFADNCATRLRDLVDRASGGAVRRQLEGRPIGTTFRALVREGFANRLGVVLLGELLLGRGLDRPIDAWQGSFLPRILSAELRRVKLGGRALASEPEPLHLRQGPSVAGVDPRRGLWLLWALTGACLLLGGGAWLAVRRRLRVAGALLLPLALALGLIAVTVWTLSAITLGHLPELSGNENLLHLWPTDLLLCLVAVRFLRGRFHAGRPLRVYALLRIGIASLALLGHALGLLLQPLPPVLLSLGLGLSLLLVARALPRQLAVPPAAESAQGLEGGAS